MTAESITAVDDPVSRSIADALRVAVSHQASRAVAESLASALAARRSGLSERTSEGPTSTDGRDGTDGTDATPARRLDPATLARVLDHMRTRLDQPLTLGDLARQAHLSKYHFLRLFAATVGTTPHRYLTALRVAHGAHLLLSTRMTVAAVAERCGYATPSRFSAAFRARYGRTPGQFREDGVAPDATDGAWSGTPDLDG